MTSNAKRIRVALAGGLVALVAIWVINRGPSYQGRTMRQWFDYGLTSPTNIQEFGPVFLKFGDRGCTYLMGELTATVPKWKLKAIEWGNRLAVLVKRAPVRAPDVAQRRQLACRLLGYFEDRAASQVIELLNAKEMENRLEAIRAMAELGPSAANKTGPVLIRLLKDPSPVIVYEAITSLGMNQYEPESVVPVLIEFLRDPNPRVRVEASYALGTYAPMPELTLQPLTRALGDADNVVRGNATRALSKMGRRAGGSVELLERLLDDDPLSSSRAVEALAYIAGEVPENVRKEYKSARDRALAGRDKYFQLMAHRATVRLGGSEDGIREVYEVLLTDKRNWHSLEAVEAVAELKPRPKWRSSLLEQATNHPNGLVRAKALAALRE